MLLADAEKSKRSLRDNDHLFATAQRRTKSAGRIARWTRSRRRRKLYVSSNH